MHSVRQSAAHSRAAALASTRAWANSLEHMPDRGSGQRRTVGRCSPASYRGIAWRFARAEAIPVDGLIREGIGFISQKRAVSGEPFAVVRRPGDRVLAGTISHDATFRIEATMAGDRQDKSTSCCKRLNEAKSRPASVQAQADRLRDHFLAADFVGTACLTFAVWTAISTWQIRVFSMRCRCCWWPVLCAAGLATPIVLWSTLNRLAGRGLIVCGGDYDRQRLSQIDSVYFRQDRDAYRKINLLWSILRRSLKAIARARILGWLSLIEAQSQHPIARPFSQLPRPFSLEESPRVLSLRVIPGCGIEGKIEQNGDVHLVRAGRPEWIGQSSSLKDEASLLARLHAKTGHRIDFEIDGNLAAIALVTERLRDCVPEMLTAKRILGLTVHVLTGDTRENGAAALSLPQHLTETFCPEQNGSSIVDAETKLAGGH